MANRAILHRLPYVTQAIAAPLALGAGIVDTVDDIDKGAPRDVAVLGNLARTGLVYGAGLLAGDIPGIGFLAGPYASYWMNKNLPRGAGIGQNMTRQLSDPQMADALLFLP